MTEPSRQRGPPVIHGAAKPSVPTSATALNVGRKIVSSSMAEKKGKETPPVPSTAAKAAVSSSSQAPLISSDDVPPPPVVFDLEDLTAATGVPKKGETTKKSGQRRSSKKTIRIVSTASESAAKFDDLSESAAIFDELLEDGSILFDSLPNYNSTSCFAC